MTNIILIGETAKISYLEQQKSDLESSISKTNKLVKRFKGYTAFFAAGTVSVVAIATRLYLVKDGYALYVVCSGAATLLALCINFEAYVQYDEKLRKLKVLLGVIQKDIDEIGTG